MALAQLSQYRGERDWKLTVQDENDESATCSSTKFRRAVTKHMTVPDEKRLHSSRQVYLVVLSQVKDLLFLKTV